MRLFTRGTDIEIEDLRVGRIRVQVRENIIDRLAGFFSPEWKLQRLRARAALDGAPASAAPPGRRMISRGYSPPPKRGSGPYAESGGTFDRLVDGYQAGNGCSRGAAIRAVATDHPDAHEKYVRELNG
ncbi:MAG: hypothetical protein WC978_00215 [bacterium]